jgi:hypothetical protein
VSGLQKWGLASLCLMLTCHLFACGTQAVGRLQVVSAVSATKKVVGKVDDDFQIFLNGERAPDWLSANPGQRLTFSVAVPVGSKIVWRTTGDALSGLDSPQLRVTQRFGGGYDVMCTVTLSKGETATDKVRVLVSEPNPLPTPMPMPPVPFPPRP